MNNTAKAMESGLKCPTTSTPKAAVQASPATTSTISGQISRQLRSAIHSNSTVRPRESTIFSTAPSARVANSSSAIGILPVMRMVMPGRARPAAAARIASVAEWPAASSEKSSTGWTKTKRRVSSALAARPVIIRFQSGSATRPARAASAAALKATSGLANWLKLASPRATPSMALRSKSATPRRLGSAARLPSSGCASISRSVRSRTSSSERNSAP